MQRQNVFGGIRVGRARWRGRGFIARIKLAVSLYLNGRCRARAACQKQKKDKGQPVFHRTPPRSVF